MEIILCIDDTDDLESKGTGELCSEIAAHLKERGWGETFGVTRHQLLIHEDIPFTSHNSSMCFQAEIEEDSLGNIIAYASQFLAREGAAGSDPGLCVVVPAWLSGKDELLQFGRNAKHSVLTKEAAYRTALKLGVHLSEHGGTGQGVIGALAGAGLRLSGNDGRYKGKFPLTGETGIRTVAEIRTETPVTVVKTPAGYVLKDDERVKLDGAVKVVLLAGQPTLLVTENDSAAGINWRLCSKEQLRAY